MPSLEHYIASIELPAELHLFPPLLEKAIVEKKFQGVRLIRVSGYRGSISLNDLTLRLTQFYQSYQKQSHGFAKGLTTWKETKSALERLYKQELPTSSSPIVRFFLERTLRDAACAQRELALL